MEERERERAERERAEAIEHAEESEQRGEK